MDFNNLKGVSSLERNRFCSHSILYWIIRKDKRGTQGVQTIEISTDLERNTVHFEVVYYNLLVDDSLEFVSRKKFITLEEAHVYLKEWSN